MNKLLAVAVVVGSMMAGCAANTRTLPPRDPSAGGTGLGNPDERKPTGSIPDGTGCASLKADGPCAP